jgi:VanZ family protein
MNRLLQLALWLAVLVALIFALWPQSPDVPGNPSDKLQHFAAFFTLAVLGGLAYPQMSLRRLFAALVVFGGLIELAQLHPAVNRNADWGDLLVDVLGTFAGVLLVDGLWRGRRRRRRARRGGTG